MARRKKRSRKKPVKVADLDLNKDGVLDAKDKAIAAKTLATDFKDIPVPEPKPEGRLANKDISLTYRKGDLVPESQIDQWRKMGINWQVWFE